MLEAKRYASKEHSRLVEALTITVKGNKEIDISKLRNYIKRTQSATLTQTGAIDKLARFDPKVRGFITKISDFLTSEKMTIKDLHNALDSDKDGEVDKREFLENMGQFKIPTIRSTDLGFLFDSLDINDRAKLNLVEFSLFIKGAELSKKEKLT